MHKAKVKLSQILEVWESWNGWYWFVTEYHEDNIAFGLVRGFETEWGYFSLEELSKLRPRAWKVPKKNWDVCPCVEDDDGLPAKGFRPGHEKTKPRAVVPVMRLCSRFMLIN